MGLPGEVVIDTLPSGGYRVSNPSTGVWGADPSARWQLIEELRIGHADGEGPYVFGTVGSVIEGPLERVWVADPQAGEIRIFDRDGGFVRSVGRRGQGPGEFGRLATVHAAPDGTVWADDAGLRRWVVFDSAGTHTAVHAGNSNLGGAIRRWTVDGHLLEVIIIIEPGRELTDATTLYSIRQLTPEGGLGRPDTVPAPRLADGEMVHFLDAAGSRRITRAVPLVRNAMISLGFHGDFWVTDGGDRYLIHRLSFVGDTLLTLERAYEPIPVSSQVREAALTDLEPPEGLRSDDNDPDRIPEHYPAFNAFYPSTDGSLWVRRHSDGELEVLDVFGSDGIYLGPVEFPGDMSRFRVSHITEDRIYGIETDDLGVATVMVLRIERP
jgi:hypothetical protein